MKFRLVSIGSLATCALAASSMLAAQSNYRPSTSTASASKPAAPRPDPRIGLKAGWFDAGQAAWNMRLVSNTPPSADFINRNDPNDFRFINSDLTIRGNYVIQGNFNGLQVWDISNPKIPKLFKAFVCPGSQSDVSVYRNLLFVSGEALNGRTDCGTQGVTDTVSHERLRGIRIFDGTDLANPKHLVDVQTCRGSHTHTVVTSPNDTDNVYIYVSGTAPVRSPNELAGCAVGAVDSTPNTALFRIEVIQVPLAHPEQAHIVSSPRIFQDLVAPPRHGETPEDIAEQKREADSARAAGGFVVTFEGQDLILGRGFTTGALDSIVKARGGTGTPTAADTATLRANLDSIFTQRVRANRQRQGVNPKSGPTQCHDITVYPAIGLAGGACAGYGLLLDIKDPANPKRVAAVSDSNFSFWHSATFNNDGSKILFTDEWGGGLQPRCRSTDKPEWGADAIFTRDGNNLAFKGYYKLPVAQTKFENCVAHNGTLIPVPGRDIMVQGWYQGGVSVFDWTDPAHPTEIAFFDRGPMDSTKLVGAGSWSAYWYNGLIISSEIARGLDIFELTPSTQLTQNEIDAAKLVHFDYLNAQDQQKLVWPADFVVARAYLDQLARSNGLAKAKINATRDALSRAEKASGAARKDALTKLATQLNTDAQTATDKPKMQLLIGVVQDLNK
ncbi:MAG TPA: DUF4398 domain-containing protein [Gemmatimonadales bacterium]|nr:DUF4398 domain-containing protein [Gemmatimonadales bacterium]